MENGRDRERGWFTAKEAANYARIHLVTLYRYVKRRKKAPRFHRVGRQYRFPKKEFIAWADGPQK